jgi:ABC-type polysaccharide/polyol phosphate transport system ATPase subunit
MKLESSTPLMDTNPASPTPLLAPPPVIVVDKLYKRYTRVEAQTSLRHEALILIRRLVQRRDDYKATQFYALKDINFTVQKGESVGIVGRNGSGKTTLLRVLAGIARPTSGTAHVTGRLTALLGLGAGFLRDLSGRKNIYLNAAIYGMPPHEVDQIIEQIIDFSEIRDFIDTPIKHYSSGMNARLAFSVAVHILPEIIFLDEVLAVGDAAFQKKCIDHIHKLKAEGRTILFVSHDTASVAALCSRAIWLHYGKVIMDGPSADVLPHYAAEAHLMPAPR